MAQAYLPVPQTWTAGPIKAPRLRSDVSGTIQLLAQPPLFSGAALSTGQTIPSGTATAMVMDTENNDNWSGHSLFGDLQNYNARLAGWYLCEAQASLDYTGGSGITQSLIGFSVLNGTVANYGGPIIENAASTIPEPPAVAKLIEMTNVVNGIFGDNDYVQGLCYQSTGSDQALHQTATSFPWFNVQWVAASSGTAGLPAPANPSWPVPPSYVTSSFLNANIRDTIEFLIYPPIMEFFYNSTGATLASQSSLPATGTTINLDTATVDNYSAFNNSTNTWTAPVAGVYYCYGQIAFTSLATSVAFAAGLTITSANYNSGSTFTYWPGSQVPQASNAVCACVRRRLRLAAGDTVKLAGSQHDSGGNAVTFLGFGNQTRNRLIIVWENG